MDDGPMYEAEIVGDRSTVRATVDVTDAGRRTSMLAAEPNEGPLHQYAVRMEVADWDRLIAIATEARRLLIEGGAP